MAAAIFSLPLTAASSQAAPASSSVTVSSPVTGPAPVPSPAAHPVKDACGQITRPGWMTCLSEVRTDVRSRRGVLAAGLAAGQDGTPSGYGPSSLQSAYLLPSATSGAGETVAVVDAYDDPQAESDLQVYRAQYGLPLCDTANGCFRKVAQDGSTAYPAADAGWALEESLDIDMVSAICPNCGILLVEANDASVASLGSAVNMAVALGAKYVSNSYGGAEDPSQTAADSSYFNHPGVVITASSGDFGYGAQYPAASRYVTAVGGTTLVQDSAAPRGWAETAWFRAGSGCSVYEVKPDWQTDSGCATRSVADVSAVADPDTGVAIYDTGPGYGGWLVVGGTSVASPVIASVYALAGSPAAGSYPASYPYADPSDLNDITTGTADVCSVSYLCNAGPGYDGPTGLGSPVGVAAFAAGPHGTVSGTVTDASTGKPLAEAEVDIGTRSVRTSSSGIYSLPLPAGSYPVTVRYFGYATQTANGVQVTDAATTREDFELQALPSVTLSGKVTDGSGHGWPLYAKISVTGTPVIAYTDPATGEYSLTLPQNASYDVTADAVSAGYAQAVRIVQAGTTSVTQDFGVAVIAQTCAALGYQFSYDGTTQTFDAPDTAPGTAPAGWSVINASGTSYGWEFGNPGGRPDYSGTGNFAVADSAARQADEDTELVSPVVDLSQDTSPYLQFNSYLEGSASDSDSVDVSTDGGQTWTSVMSQTGNPGSHGPPLITIPLPMAAGHSGVQVRFHFTSNSGQYWEIDNVFLGNRTCAPTPGGLVEGTVNDGNTGAGLTSATVTSATGQSVTTSDGLFDMFLPAGRQQVTAAMPRYASEVTTATVTAEAATTVNFALQAGQLSVTPGAVSAITASGGSSTSQITFGNTGKLPVDVTLYQEPGGFTPLGERHATASGAPLRRTAGTFTPLFPGHAQSTRSTRSTTARPAKNSGNTPWVPVTGYPTAIMDNAVATDQASGLVYSVGGRTTTEVTSAGYVYDPRTRAWTELPPLGYPRDAAQAAFINGKLYVVGGWNNVGGLVPQLEIYDPAAGTWSAGPSIPVPYAAAGVAVLDGKMYVIAGCASACLYNQVQVYDPVAGTWSTAATYPVVVGWPSCGTIGEDIYCAGGVAYTTGINSAFVYSAASGNWSAIAPLPVDLWGGGYTAANGELLVSGGVTGQGAALTNQGYAYDPSAGSWSALPNSGYAAYRVGSACGLYLIGGSSGGLNPSDNAQELPGYAACGSAQVPWLSQSADSFTVDPGETVTVSVTLNAADPSVTQPGSYTASLGIREDTPYQASPVPVTMTVPA